ncbi:MAG: nucleotidyltransferase domain-containing protein [Promethearchaeota archaeon]
MGKLREELHGLSKYWTVVYGSVLSPYFIPGRSDIDVAVVTRKRDREENLEVWHDLLGRVHPRYDVRVFELLPLQVQADILDNYIVVFGDPLELSEYFYKFRVAWKDVEKRVRDNQFESVAEKLEGIEWCRELQKRARRVAGE